MDYARINRLLQEIVEGEIVYHHPDEHAAPTKAELEKALLNIAYTLAKKGATGSFQDYHFGVKPMFGAMFGSQYKKIVTQGINRLRKRGFLQMDPKSHVVDYQITPEGLHALKTGNLKKVKASATVKKQREIDHATLMRFVLEHLYDVRKKYPEGVSMIMVEWALQDAFSGVERVTMMHLLHPVLKELTKKGYVEETWSGHGWNLSITPAGAKARLHIKIPEF